MLKIKHIDFGWSEGIEEGVCDEVQTVLDKADDTPPIVEYPDGLDFEIGGNANQVCPGVSDNDNPEELLDTIDMNRLIRENNCRGRGYSFKILRGRSLYRKTNIANALMGVQIIGPALTESEAPFHFDSTKGEDNDFTKINGELVNKFTGEVMQMPESEDSNQYF